LNKIARKNIAKKRNESSAIDHKVLLLNARRIAQIYLQIHLILLAIEDISEKA
jgi:hypothetical protein